MSPILTVSTNLFKGCIRYLGIFCFSCKLGSLIDIVCCMWFFSSGGGGGNSSYFGVYNFLLAGLQVFGVLKMKEANNVIQIG